MSKFRRELSALPVYVLDSPYVAPLRNQSASYAIRVENSGQISDFVTRCKISGVMDEMSESRLGYYRLSRVSLIGAIIDDLGGNLRVISTFMHSTYGMMSCNISKTTYETEIDTESLQHIVLYCIRLLNKLTDRNLRSHNCTVVQCLGYKRVM